MPCGLDNACGFFGGVTFRFFDNFRRTAFCINDAPTTLFVDLLQFHLDALLGDRQLMLAALCGGQAFRYSAGTLVECLHQWRPHIFHGEQRQNKEYDKLRKQRCVQVHVIFSLTVATGKARMRLPSVLSRWA